MKMKMKMKMKKIMIAACAIALAAVSQAASVTWSSGAFTDLPSCEGSFGFSYSDDIMAYVWEFSASDWASAGLNSGADVWSAYKSGKLDVANAQSGLADWMSGAAEIAGGSSWKEGDTVYAAILYLHNDAGDFEKADYYMANTASGTAADAGATISDLGNTVGGLGGSTATAWTAVPEPTSGLLMLVGLAGLALRRRRA
jgi:hypothetical protein